MHTNIMNMNIYYFGQGFFVSLYISYDFLFNYIKHEDMSYPVMTKPKQVTGNVTIHIQFRMIHNVAISHIL